MAALIVLIGFMAITVIMGIILTETDKKTRIIIIIVITVLIMILLIAFLTWSSVVVFFESCDSCVKGIGAMG